MNEREISWQAPPFEAPDDKKLSFCRQAIDSGVKWNEEQCGTDDRTRAMDILAGKTGCTLSGKWANFTTGDLKRDIREIIETLANIRPIWGYQTDNDAFRNEANMMNKVTKSVYLESFVDRSIRDALQFGAITGAGFLYPFYSRAMFGSGEGEFVFMPLGQPDVLPVQLPRSRDYQKAYIVTLAVPMGVAEAHARFPLFQSKLKPFAKKKYGKTAGGEQRRGYDQNRWRMHSIETQLEQFCVPLNSEILTREGWKKYNEITVGQEVMGYNKETQRCEWTLLDGVNVFQDKDVYEYGTKGFKVRCTKDHKWAVRKRTGKYNKEKGFKETKPEMLTLDECTRQKTVIVQAAPAPDGPGLETIYADDLLNRKDAVRMVMQMTSGERRAFILGMLYGEGTRRSHGEGERQKGTTQFAQNDGPVYDAMKLACALEGIATLSGREVIKGKSCKTFTLSSTPHRGTTTLTKKMVSTEDVWCPTTGLGTWVMRQDDLITITGNCDIYYTYILDLRINYGKLDDEGKPILGEDGNPIGEELKMGQEGTSWYYTVPYVGQSIQRFEGGRMVTRDAAEDDCRVYPRRRLMISCDQALMYDGPAFDMHGMVPLIPFYLDDWAWEGTGYSLFRGTASTQDAIDDLVRSVYRIAMARANPGKTYNTDATTGDKSGKITSRQAEAMDPFDPNATFGVDGENKEPVMRPPMPEWCYNIPEWVMKTVEFLQQSINKQLGLDQIQALQKLKANIDNPEKLLDAEGPVAIGTSRSMEQGLRDLGEMMKYLIIQYMTVGRTMQYVGANGIAPEVFDYSPEMLTPSHMPGEQTISDTGETVASQVDPFTRTRTFAQNLRYFITPHSLHYIAQKEMKLNLLALLGKNVPVDPETIAAQFDLPNWGSIEGSTIKEKVFNWAKEQLEEKADIAKLEKSLGMGEPEEGGGKPGPKPGQGGRPASNKKGPQVKQKGAASGGRAVVSTS